MCKVVRNEVEMLVVFADDDKMVTESIDRAVTHVVEYFMTKEIILSTAESNCTWRNVSQIYFSSRCF